MTDEAYEAAVRALAETQGAPLPPEYVGEAASAWRLMQPHLRRVLAVDLPEHAEPAALFRP